MRSILKNNNSIIVLIGAVLIACIFAQGIDKANCITIINDEFGYWGIAASLAGKDWSGLLSSTPYYSFGYSILLCPLFYLFSNPAHMYQAALVLNVFMILGSYLLTYLCGRKLFRSLNPFILTLISFAVTVYSNNIVQSQVAWTETLLYFLYWLLLFVFIELLEKPSVCKAGLYGILNISIYYVHQRALGVLLSSSILIIILFLCRKISLLQATAYCLIVLSTFLGGMSIKAEIIETLFTNKELAAMNDYSGQFSQMGTMFGSFEGIRLLLISILGKLYYLGVATFLTAWISLIIIGKQAIMGSLGLLRCRFKKTDDQTLIHIYLFMSFCATFLISAIAMYRPEGRLDLLIYGRYMEFAIGPLLLIGLEIIFCNHIKLKSIFTSIVLLVLLTGLVNHVYNGLETNVYNAICASVLAYFFNNAPEISGLAFWITIFVIAVFLISLGLSRNKSVMFDMAAIIVVSCTWIYLAEYTWITDRQIDIKDNLDNVAEEIRKLDEEYRICMILDDANSDIYAKYLQFLLQDIPICEMGINEFVENNGNERNKVIYLFCNSDDLNINVPDEKYIIKETKWITAFTTKK